MFNDNNILTFISLLRAGLWEKDVQLSSFGQIDFNEVYRLAEEQSVVGLVAAGIEHVNDVKIPKEMALQFAGQTLQLEQRNKEMNRFVSQLIEELRQEGIYALLVKGQGVAQCYERPLWRASGDIDLLLSYENYQKAKKFLISKATNIEDENEHALHLGLKIDKWIVELHGSLRSCTLSKMDKEIDAVQQDVLLNGSVRAWMCGNKQVFIPSPNYDVFFIFTHIIKHFFHGGIGLRQVADWCRLLWTFKDKLNLSLLEKRIENACLMSEWHVFSHLAVKTLGFPREYMPFYVESVSVSRKADRVLAFILEVGNFGNNRDKTYYSEKSMIIVKATSLWRHTIDGLHHLTVFPLDTLRVWGKIITSGFAALLKK